MELVIIGLAVVVFLVIALAWLSRLGRYIKRNEQRAYVQNVLHAVETRGEFDRNQRNR